MLGNSPAHKILKLFASYMDLKDIKYTVHEDNDLITVDFVNGDHYDKIRITFVADDDGDSVAVRAFSLRQYSKAQLPAAYAFCNRMNYKYRWVRFYVDSDDELTAAIDAVVTPATAGAECFELLARTVNIVDDVLGEN